MLSSSTDSHRSAKIRTPLFYVLTWTISAILFLSGALAQSIVRPSLDTYMAVFEGSSFNSGWKPLVAADALKKIDPIAEEVRQARDLMIALLNSVAASQRPGEFMSEELLPVQDIWAKSFLVPPASAGNDLQFIALQLLPRSIDTEVLDWIDSNYARVPPPFLEEAKRRAANSDLDRAMQYFFDASIRFRFESLRCQDPSLGDLHLIWGGYASAELLELHQESAIKAAHERAILAGEQRWGEILPDDLAEWQPCHRSKGQHSEEDRKQAARSGRGKLLDALRDTITKHGLN